jgi:uncharacterized OsmC-like protein
MPHEAEIRTARGRGAVAEPQSILVAHHRAGTAEIKMAEMSGGSLLHLALAGCVFNNVLRMAGDRAISVEEASVRVSGGFTDDGASTGVECHVDVLGDASTEELRELAQAAFDDSTVVAVLRHGAEVRLGS